MDPENWTTKFAKLDMQIGSNFGGGDESETQADRSGVEGEGGVGGGAGGLHGEPVGVEVRRSCDADRALETAAGGAGGVIIFRRPPKGIARPGGVDRAVAREDRPLERGGGLA